MVVSIENSLKFKLNFGTTRFLELRIATSVIVATKSTKSVIAKLSIHFVPAFEAS